MLDKYCESFMEAVAEAIGVQYAKKYIFRDYPKKSGKINAIVMGIKKWFSPTIRGDNLTRRENYSISNTERGRGNESKSVKQANEKAKNYVREWYAGIEKDRYDVNRSLTSLINLTKQKAKDFSSAGVKISDKQIREIMPFLRERTEFPEKLDRPDLKKVWNGLSSTQKAELTIMIKSKKYYKFLFS